MRIAWTSSSKADLHDILTYLADLNPIAAVALIERIESRVELLARFPHAGRPGRVVGTRELPIVGTAYIAAYRLNRKEDRIEVLAVRHGARRWPETL
ncbi:MAG: type II toxin-antitoxin system RelE/ParE family toxin [Pseudomonadota bacterium]